MSLSTMSTAKKLSKHSTEIANDLLKIKSVEFNFNDPYVWVSGTKSPIYCDNRKINSYPEIRNKFVNYFVELIQEYYPTVEVIAGVATGGIPLGILIADRMKLPFIYVRQERKEHGLMKQVEGDFNIGAKTVLIEDHISTGGSSWKALQGLLDVKLDVLGLASIMTYGFSFP
jgi:orotate phosphoribosyltransferase